MASTTEAHSVSAKSTSDITAEERNKSGHYGVTSDKDNKPDNQGWQYKQNDE